MAGFEWEVLNWAASVGFSLALLPQLLRTLRTRRADDLSVPFLVLVLLASTCMLAYMLHDGNPVFAVAQLVNLLVWGFVFLVRMHWLPARPHT